MIITGIRRPMPSIMKTSVRLSEAGSLAVIERGTRYG
jgi:hypothetical protein